MHAFIVAEDFVFQTTRFHRAYQGGAPEGEVRLERLIVDTGGEGELVRKAMEASKSAATVKTGDPVSTNEAADQDAVAPSQYVRGVPESALLGWAHFPARLGRRSSRCVPGPGLHHHEEPEPLSMQLAALKARHPGKQHFRLAVVNAFGSNLGDCMLGMTAMRVVADYLGRHLESFVVDLLLGANTSPGNFDIAGYEPWIGALRTAGPTVQEFGDYDAYFDCTGLISLPRFYDMPIVDWYLWWFGLDPSIIPVEQKRNRVHLVPAACQVAQDALKATSSPKVLFNYKASVNLRTCPESAAVALVKKMLALDPDIRIVLPAPLPFKHARVTDVSEIKGTDRFNALVSMADCVISVDTYSIHLGDAVGVPVVGLYASIPPDAYPYYPLHDGVLIPGGEQLPAFKKTKVSDDEWGKIKDVYEQAWQQLDARQILARVKALMDKRKGHPRRPVLMKNGPHIAPTFKLTPEGRVLVHETAAESWHKAVTRTINMSDIFFKAGGISVVVAPGQSRLLRHLASRTGVEGMLHVFEPRHTRRQLMSLDLLEAAPQTPVVWHDALPVNNPSCDLAVENALGETSPLRWGNSRKMCRTSGLAIDALQLPVLSALFIMAPMPFRSALQSGKATLEKHKPPVVCAPVFAMDDVRSIAEELIPLGYQCWVDYLEGRQDGAMLVVAFPLSLKVQASGMKRIVLN